MAGPLAPRVADNMYEFAVTPAITQLRRPGVTITEVAQGASARKWSLPPNDRIVKVNGRTVRDYLDFRFQTGGETELTFQVRKPSGELLEIEFDRDEVEDLGLMFEQIVPRQCANECIFCFCKGNPEDAGPRCLFATRTFGSRFFTATTQRSRR